MSAPLTSIYVEDEERELPTKWAICSRCRGEGSVSRIPGAFTGADLDEWFGDGEERYEFISEYTRRGGIYDENCPDCQGSGKVKEVDTEKLDLATHREWLRQQQEVWEDEAIQAAEIAAGC